MIQGLHYDLCSMQEQTALKLEVANDTFAAPITADNANDDAIRLQREIEKTKAAIAEDESIIEDLQTLITRLEKSLYKTRHRSLLITHLENAQDRLRRELGDKATH